MARVGGSALVWCLALTAHAQDAPTASVFTSSSVHAQRVSVPAGYREDIAKSSRPLARRVQRRRVHDPWFRADKVKHFFMAFFIQSASYAGLRSLDVEHGAAIGGASVLTAAFSIGKEVHDSRRGGPFSIPDLAWDALGAGTASLLISKAER